MSYFLVRYSDCDNDKFFVGWIDEYCKFWLLIDCRYDDFLSFSDLVIFGAGGMVMEYYSVWFD